MDELKGCDFCKFLNYEKSDDFYLYEVGSNKCEPSYSYSHTVSKRTIVHFVLSGKGFVEINGNRFDVAPHHLSYENGGEVIVRNRFQHSGYCRCCWVL